MEHRPVSSWDPDRMEIVKRKGRGLNSTSRWKCQAFVENRFWRSSERGGRAELYASLQFDDFMSTMLPKRLEV